MSRVSEFDLWRPGYGGSVVNVLKAGTTTLASLFYDEAMTEEAPNPQVLNSMISPNGVRYGKWARPIYTDDAYYLNINGIEHTGVFRPGFSSLQGENATDAVITADGSNYLVDLGKFAALTVNAAMYGEFVSGSSGVAATNTQTLELAIAALANGGQVIVPAGTYNINSIEVPQGVVIVGSGRESTVLKSVLGSVSFLIVGDRAGFKDITLDGNSLSSSSVGVRSVGNNETVFDHVMIRRFETGIHFLGGKGFIWNDLSIENTVTGAKLHGDLDSGGTNNGGPFENLVWQGGLVSVASAVGVSLSYENAICHNISLQSVGFEDCLGTGLVINGAQEFFAETCWFDGNTTNIDIHDDSLVLTTASDHENNAINIEFMGGIISGGIVVVSGNLENVSLKSMKLLDVDFNMSVPIKNFLVVQDCFEDSNVTITGDTTKFLRSTTSLNGSAFGLTTSNTATKAWNITLDPGQIVYLKAKVIARGRNVTDRAIYDVACGAYLAGASLAYDAQTANFTVGTVITGATSGATARIQADSDSGTTGTLTLIDVQGTFIDNEIITDNNGTPGSASVNGTLSIGSASLDTVGNEAMRTAYETDTDFAAAFAVNGRDVELRVTGDTSKTVEWSVYVEVVSIG